MAVLSLRGQVYSLTPLRPIGERKESSFKMRMTREWEQNYLSITGQIGDLIQKKSAASTVQMEIEKVHSRLLDIGRAMFNSDDARMAEQDYLAASREMKDLLGRKSQVYAISDEIEGLHGKLMDLGRNLGWADVDTHAASMAFAPEMDGMASGEVEVDGKLHKLQQQIEDLKTVLG